LDEGEDVYDANPAPSATGEYPVRLSIAASELNDVDNKINYFERCFQEEPFFVRNDRYGATSCRSR
jgi:hypothetical protein